MMQGIAIFGLNGGGKSTLAHALAKRIGYFEMDVEDYYFPEQSASRRWSLENDSVMETSHLGPLPFSVSRTKDEAEAAILEDIRKHPQFILSGVNVGRCQEIASRLDIAFWVRTPVGERLRRIRAREEKRFGARVLAGGDMFAQQEAFRKMVQNRDEKMAEEWARKLPCPVIVLDGTAPVADNLKNICNALDLPGMGC